MKAYFVIARGQQFGPESASVFALNHTNDTAAWIAAKMLMNLLEKEPRVAQYSLISATDKQKMLDQYTKWTLLYPKDQIWTIEIRTTPGGNKEGLDVQTKASPEIFALVKDKLLNCKPFESASPNEFQKSRYLLVDWNLSQMTPQKCNTFYQDLLKNISSL
jgi:hypothetical protein